MEYEFTQHNTQGYTDEELAALNAELAERLGDIEEGTDEFWTIVKAHADEVAGR